MRVSKRGQVLELAGKFRHPVETPCDLWKQDLEGVAVDDDVGVVRHVARRRAKVNDATS